MAFEIYMYNAWFGDCFLVENNGSNLLVDFGIHSASTIPNGFTRDDIHSKIERNILTLSHPTLLISHFHDDHVSGLLYMMNKIKTSSTLPIFQKVYIPDIWNITDSPIIIVVLLLEELLKHAILSQKRGAVTLFELMRFLCVNTGSVVPIKRGQNIEGKRYIALWPDSQCVSDYANSYLKGLGIDVIPTHLIKLAENLCAFVIERANMVEINERSQNLLSQLQELEHNFFELIDDREIAEILTKIIDSEEDIYLNHLGNNISIVFHNVESMEGENLLFTGDLEEKFLKKIASNYDKKFEMQLSYDFIKIPHHGTKGGKSEHYFDFKTYDPKCFIIPNGCVHGVRGSWEVCKEYGDDIKAKSAKVVCANSNFCESNCGRRFKTCSCINKQFVFPNLYIKVK